MVRNPRIDRALYRRTGLRWRIWALPLLLMLLLGAGIVFNRLHRIRYFAGPLYTLARPIGPARDGRAVILLSGDMGFNVGLTPKVAQRLVEAGYPVIGVNSLTFAGPGCMPAEVTALLRDAIHRALALDGVKQVVLDGQSFGADLLHVGLVGLPQQDRDRVALVVLTVPTDSIYLSINLREHFELGTPDLQPLASARLLDWVPVTCIRGAEETKNICPLLTQPNVRTVILPGIHKLNNDDAAVAAVVKDAIVSHSRLPLLPSQPSL